MKTKKYLTTELLKIYTHMMNLDEITHGYVFPVGVKPENFTF